jgi:hypothetical protein
MSIITNQTRAMCKAVEAFHEHLNICTECGGNKLCDTGDRLLKLAEKDDGPRVAMFVNFFRDPLSNDNL